MKVTVLTKARIGFAIALGVPIGAAEFAAFTHIEFLRRNVLLCCLVFGGAGVLCWLTGQFSGVKQVRSLTQGESVRENPLSFLKSLRYWGIVLILSGGSIYSFSAFRNQQPRVVQARPAVVFPVLELQGHALVVVHADDRLLRLRQPADALLEEVPLLVHDRRHVRVRVLRAD